MAQQLQGDVLEGERRPVEQLQQPVVGIELAQGRHGDVIEAGIRLIDQVRSSASLRAPSTNGARTVAATS